MTNPDTSRQDAALQQLMEEMVAAKQAVQDVLKISPEDIQLHRIHGMYTGHILDIRKTMMQEQAVDRDQLLVDEGGGQFSATERGREIGLVHRRKPGGDRK